MLKTNGLLSFSKNLQVITVLQHRQDQRSTPTSVFTGKSRPFEVIDVIPTEHDCFPKSESIDEQLGHTLYR